MTLSLHIQTFSKYFHFTLFVVPTQFHFGPVNGTSCWLLSNLNKISLLLVVTALFLFGQLNTAFAYLDINYFKFKTGHSY